MNPELHFEAGWSKKRKWAGVLVVRLWFFMIMRTALRLSDDDCDTHGDYVGFMGGIEVDGWAVRGCACSSTVRFLRVTRSIHLGLQRWHGFVSPLSWCPCVAEEAFRAAGGCADGAVVAVWVDDVDAYLYSACVCGSGELLVDV